MRSHATFIFVTLAACRGATAERPRVPAAADLTIAATHDGHTLRGVAGDGAHVYAALGSAADSLIEARDATTTQWSARVAGNANDLAVAATLLAVATSVRGERLRGEPAAMVHAFDRASGRPIWQRALESTDWVLISSLAALGPDLVVGGSFAGTLRVANRVVTSGGGSDGFVARIAANGTLAWLVRLGGAGADGVQGVAVGGERTAPRIAIAGTFSLGADILGAPLASIEPKSPFGDAFVAELDGAGARRWSATFGSRGDDAVAGVAVDAAGRVIVAANVHEVVSIAGAPHVPRGTGDGLVVWYSNTGDVGPSVLIGGNDFDGIRAIAAVGERVVVGGFFSGTIDLADRTLTAGGGDDSFIAALDASGTVVTAWHAGGAGREEVTALSAIPGGFVAGVAHSANATIGGVELPEPAAGSTAAALIARGLR